MDQKISVMQKENVEQMDQLKETISWLQTDAEHKSIRIKALEDEVAGYRVISETAKEWITLVCPNYHHNSDLLSNF